MVWMPWLMLGFSLVVMVGIVKLILDNQKTQYLELMRKFESLLNSTRLERAELLNRIQADSLTAFAHLQTPMNSISEYDTVQGLNDEEEVKRFGAIQGVGEEVIVDFSDDLKDLGIINE